LPALEAIATERKWRIVTYLRSRCPWTQTLTTVGAGDADRYSLCHDWGRDVLDKLTANPPDLLVTTDRPVVGTPEDPTPGTASFGAIARGMTAYWDRMREVGTHVVAVRETPEMGMDVADCLSTPGADMADCGRPSGEALAEEPPTIQATRATAGGVGLLDMTDLLCPDGLCAPVLGNVVVYRDAHHLTRSYTLSLAPYLEERLLELIPLTG
jgi:hypothetical protein